MKFLLTILFLFLTSVGILYYLISNNNFLPTNLNGEYLWLNISVFLFLLLIIFFSFLCIVFFILFKYILKKSNQREVVVFCIKFSGIVSVGMLVVLLLNLFHVLSWEWGLVILFVVLISSLVI